jgi:NTP pyrophosphatase (non-canonical NTP hydrolase)
MEGKCRKHDKDRGVRGWKEIHIRHLLHRICEEYHEALSAALEARADTSNEDFKKLEDLLWECVDIANFAMMAADNIRLKILKDGELSCGCIGECSGHQPELPTEVHISPQKLLDKLVQKAMNWVRFNRNAIRGYSYEEHKRASEELQQAGEEYEAERIMEEYVAKRDGISCETCDRPKDKPDDELAPCGLPCTNHDLWESKDNPKVISECQNCGFLHEHRIKDKMPRCPCGDYHWRRPPLKAKKVSVVNVPKLTFKQLQEEVGEWSSRNFGEQLPYRPLLGAVEEVGELSHAQLKMEQGIRGSVEEHQAAAQDAVGDIIVYLADYCARSGFDMQGIIEHVWGKVKQRDWKKDPKTGGDLDGDK